jgi:hypothetical protein
MLTSHPSRILPQATPFATLGIALALAWAPACGQDPASADVAQDTQAQPANCDGGARCGAVEAGAEAGGPDTTAPVLSNGLPSGTLPGGTTAATLRVSTNEAATCRWSASPATAYASMTQTFATTGGTFHTTPLSGLAAGQSYDYYLRCQDAAGNADTTDFVVSFRVASGTGAMSVSLVPSRASGVAPLAVFFDASGTIDSAVTSRPFHDLEYRWDFGDPGGSPVGGTTWVTGSGSGANSRNAALGPMAGHVFEVPGTYEVSLNVFDGSSAAGATTTITVSDPETTFAGANTVCVSMSGTFTGCPAGATHVTTGAFDTAVTDHAATNRRVLFRRGEVFTAGTSPVIAVDGPGILGAFGAGAKPVVRGPGTAPVVSLGTRGSGLYKDWRIMDLSLDGQNGHAGENVGIGAIGQFDQVTILRVDVTGTSTGFAASHWTLTAGQKSFDQWAIHDSSAKGVPDCNSPGNYICNWRIYVVGTRWSMQGNSLDNLGDPTTQHAGGSHVIRTEMLQSSVIGNNDIKGAGDFQLGIKLHAWAWGGGAGGNATANTYSERVLIADNKIEGGANPWLMSLGPQDEINDGAFATSSWSATGSAPTSGRRPTCTSTRRRRRSETTSAI